MTRVAVLRDPAATSGTAQFGAIQAVASSLMVELTPVGVRDASELERAVTAFARSPNGGLIITAGGPTLVHRDLIVTLAARHRKIISMVQSGHAAARAAKNGILRGCWGATRRRL